MKNYYALLRNQNGEFFVKRTTGKEIGNGLVVIKILEQANFKCYKYEVMDIKSGQAVYWVKTQKEGLNIMNTERYVNTKELIEKSRSTERYQRLCEIHKELVENHEKEFNIK